MPVNSVHPEYAANVSAWMRIKTCLDGSDAVKAAGSKYLPRLSGQTDDAYAQYLNGALFFNATARTHEAMLGFIFRKPPAMLDDAEGNADLDDIIADADLSESPLVSYARQVVATVASTGRAGTMVDWSEEEQRPYLAFYPELCVLNWREERQRGKLRLTLLVLLESVMQGSTADEYQASQTLRYREYRLVEGQVIVRTFEEVRETANTATRNADGTGNAAAGTVVPQQVGEDVVMSRRGDPLSFIPFIFHGCETTSSCVDKPPLADISAVNVSHYRTSADIENGRHICGTPTPYAIAFGEEDVLFLGSSHAWTTDNPGASCGFLEFTGAGLTALEKGIEEKQGQMAALGARLIEPRGGDAEAYDTVQLRASAETSTLARIAMLTSEGLSQALQIAVWWIGTEAEINPDIKYQLNGDFSSSGIRPEMLTALTAAFQQSIISRDVLFHQLQRGELYPDGWTKDEEQEAIEANPPMPMPLPGQPPGGKPEEKKPDEKKPAA